MAAKVNWKLPAKVGIEPTFSRSKRGVLPLDDLAIWLVDRDSRTPNEFINSESLYH